MSTTIEAQATELLWKQWTAVGVAGVTPPAKQAIDLEALIAFTPFLAHADPRLAQESADWCIRLGKRFISISRLRQIVRRMPFRDHRPEFDLPGLLLGSAGAHQLPLSRKSRPPLLDQPSLLQLRSRYIFGVGARADLIARLAMLSRKDVKLRAADVRPSGYTKAAISTVLEELVQAGLLTKSAGTRRVAYELEKGAPLRALVAPLPKSVPPWIERFAIVATILNTWQQFGSRKTYDVELAKALSGLGRLAASIGERPPVAKRHGLVMAVDRWATTLLEDTPWETSWLFKGEDVAARIFDALRDDIVQSIHAGEYPVGYTELEDFEFRIVDESRGVAEFAVDFTAEHPRETFSFNGSVEGTFRFDANASRRKALIDSIALDHARTDFDMGDDPS